MKNILIAVLTIGMVVAGCSQSAEQEKPSEHCSETSRSDAESTMQLLMTGCVHRQKDKTVDKTENQTKSLKDYQTVSYEMPEVVLLYSKALPDIVCTTEEKYRVWTEQECYPQNVTAINYFVENRTDTWWTFGRDWTLQIWDGAKWCPPKQKKVLFWFDEGFGKRRAPLLYCFRIPIGEYFFLPKGKYRVKKDFIQNDRKNQFLDLYAEFEVR